ncbi:MAG: BON domain-containing protein [Granulosicoccus sp.]|nr:BON domain-containing protein [Granulosicoccus sp.]
MKNKVYAVIANLLVIFACITFSACTTTPEQSPEDRELERSVERAISGGPGLSTAGISVTVLNGVAILKGSVATGIDKVLTEKVVRDVEGVAEVRNYIFVD